MSVSKHLPVYHHTGLETTGGATRVARLLMEGMNKLEVESSLSFELGEGPDTAAILPEDFGRYLPKGGIAHVHCTGNWPALLDSIPSWYRTVITLHDCELFTGGCPYPLDCPNVDEGCAEPCPRKFPDSEALRKEKLRLVERLDPILVAPSRWLARLAKSHLFRSVSVIPNGIVWPEFPPKRVEARRSLGIHPSARVCLFVAHGGTDAAYKSGSSWRRIWQAVKQRVPEALCFAVGGDTAGREGDLVIWPYVERERLALLMAAADVLLYPTKADNHSLVILEAQAQALAVVSYAVGGVPEQIAEGETGVLVEPGDEATFIESAVEMLSTPTLSMDMGKMAFTAGSRRFHVDRMVQDYMKLYGKFE
ncbi:Glycosyl transferase group 1 [Pseudodesulfovibrio profundus]|uniref:Glycosyl transferase group 1 n=1 Tax=Pseudodesulfovibrio profundus TaxID=57320 RepID=A0A2C8FAB8_9BACT|nr:glycosyltransferase [Pseudodesulfovibrio profundus]SOB59084.1 Glycosyl transferase group 1 [Pseudodesulfovibrio profundus]